MTGLIRRTAICLVSLLIISVSGRTQTCSCARAPVGSGLEGPSLEAGTWQLGLTYEYHPISDVFAGTEEIRADNRRRTSHTGLFEATFGLTDRVSVTGQFLITQQERRSMATVGTGEFLRTRGVGDALFVLCYNLVLPTRGKRLQISAGSGIKVPFGKSSLSNNGTLISADMQPGSGS